MSIYLKNANFIDWKDCSITSCNLHVDEKGMAINDDVNGDAGSAKVIDLEGKLVTKSFVCGHHHAYSGLARGMPFPAKAPTNFHEILQYIWWNLDKQLDDKMIEASALVTALYSAKNGVTYVIDHHSSPFASQGSLEIIAKAFDKVGVGHLLCIELSDRDGEKARENGLKETENYLKNSNRDGLVGLHASFTVEDDLLNRSIELMRKYDSGIHIHVAEDLKDQKDCEAKYKERVIERLDKIGALDSSKTILGHCLHLSEKERAILAKAKAYIVVNTESNLNNRVGSFLGKGLDQSRIMLGTDGMHSDMIKSAQAHYWHTHALENTGPLEVYTRLRNVHNYLSENGFSGDGTNNLVILDYDTPTPVTQDNFLGHFFYGLSSNNVSSVISQGKMIVEDRKLVSTSEEEILSFANEQAKKLWAKL